MNFEIIFICQNYVQKKKMSLTTTQNIIMSIEEHDSLTCRHKMTVDR